MYKSDNNGGKNDNNGGKNDKSGKNNKSGKSNKNKLNYTRINKIVKGSKKELKTNDNVVILKTVKLIFSQLHHTAKQIAKTIVYGVEIKEYD